MDVETCITSLYLSKTKIFIFYNFQTFFNIFFNLSRTQTVKNSGLIFLNELALKKTPPPLEKGYWAEVMGNNAIAKFSKQFGCEKCKR